MCQASKELRVSGTDVAMKALDSKDATVMVLPSPVRFTMMSSSKEAIFACTDIPAPYFVMYLAT